MSGGKRDILPSVNVKWVEKWDNKDVLQWIKVLQEFKSFEGKKTQKSETMKLIIRNKNITGKRLINCNTKKSLVDLFQNKITQETAKVLRDNLTLERSMFTKRELSKTIIRQSKWQPTINEKIRFVDTKYTPLRSYEATITKKQGSQIFVCYDGYADNPGVWVPREQWMGRVTILEDIAGKQQTNKTQPISRTKSQINAINKQNDDDIKFPKLGKKPKSVPPTNVPLVLPFHKKQVADWDNDDVTDWIDSIQIKALQQYQSAIQQNKKSFKTAAFKNKLNGKLLVKYKNGDKLFKDYAQYKLNQQFCKDVAQQLKNILDTEAAFPKFSQKRVEQWSKEDLQEWVKSLNLPKQNKVIKGIDKNDLTGKDFAGCRNTVEIMDGFDIDAATAGKLFFELQNLKPNPSTSYRKSNVKDDNDKLPTYNQATKDDFKNSLLQDAPKQPVRVEFEVGQRIDAKDGGWHDAIIKEVGYNQYNERVVKVGWLLDQWANERYDKIWTEDKWDKRIRDQETHLPFSKLVTTGKKEPRGQGNKAAYTWKHIDKWTSKELQEWINSLNLKKQNKETVVGHIVDGEITGEDFNSMDDVQQIMDSFEVKEGAAKKILAALNQVREANKRNDNSNVAGSSAQSGRGIIGLNNLGNTCFINSVIQGLLQTPGLIKYLRQSAGGTTKEKSGGVISSITNYWSGSSSSKKMAATMLDAFIEVAAAAMQAGKHDSIPPKAIVKHLRDSDVKFAHGEQGDALSAVSKMTELLDRDIIKKEQNKSKKRGGKKHPGSWLIDHTDQDDEDDIIEGNLMGYNPYKSSIREYIHFVERNIFTCLKCGWKELRYDIKEKVLLPLKDHSTTICVDIYIPSINPTGPVLIKQECVILGYCPIQTLRYQIFEAIRKKSGKDFKFQMRNVDQISIRTIKVNKNKLLSGWIEEYDAKEDCSRLINSNTSIFALVEREKQNPKDESIITVTTFNVRLDKYGNADPKASYIEFEEIPNGSMKTFSKKGYKDYPQKEMRIFFAERIENPNYKCEIDDDNATIVVIWTHANATMRYKWKKSNPEKIKKNWQCELWNECKGNVTNYGECVEFLKTKKNEYKKFAKTLKEDKVRAEFKEEWIDNSLNIALKIYEELAENQAKAIKLVYNAFANSKQSFIKQKNPIIQNIGEGFKTYCSTKILDRGAVVKCRGKCRKKCDVFKQETKIVKPSEVLIFAIDRYNSGQKFSERVGYNEFETFDKQKYELYAVCNHTGGLGYGHYWAFVKGYDDNQWYEANDRSISTMRVNNVVDQATAILLFYKKKK